MVTLDVYDYSDNLICPLYNSNSDASGQAHDITLTQERNGWKTLTFVLPSTMEVESGKQERNFRLDYIKADYLVRLHDSEGRIDGDTTDYFIMSAPRIAHENFSTTVTVQAGHISQLLKTKNLGLVFSDTEGNNVGTCRDILATILEGTDWGIGEVESFYETIRRDSNGQLIEKVRTLVASDKTGAFALISKLCDLFEARAIYHGEPRLGPDPEHNLEDRELKKRVDIVHMNPFSEPADGDLPDVAKANGVFELHYGYNVKNITHTQNTENLVTKLYAYGSYGDTTTGYCGIDECEHTEWTFNAVNLNPEHEYKIVMTDAMKVERTRYFTPTTSSSSGVLWSDQDPASMMYVWDLQRHIAYPVYETPKTSNPIQLTVAGTQNVINNASYLMDFTYYRDVGLFTDEHLQALAKFQRDIPEELAQVMDATSTFSSDLNELTRIVGTVDFVKLKNPVFTEDESGSTRISFDGIVYTTQYTLKEKDRFTWRPATSFKSNGDPLMTGCSVIYIIRDVTPLTFDKFYFTAGGKDEGYIVLNDTWETGYFSHKNGSVEQDEVFIFSSNSVAGELGALESEDAGTVTSLKNNTKIITVDHPVYFEYNGDPNNALLTSIDDTGWYGWLWQYGPYDTRERTDPNWDYTMSRHLYFYRGNLDVKRWRNVEWGLKMPSYVSIGDYFYNFGTRLAYYGTNNGWVALDKKGGDATLASYNGSSEMRISQAFGTVIKYCLSRDQYYKGLYEEYHYQHADDTALPVGNYAFSSPYGTYSLFTTEHVIARDEKLVYNTKEKKIVEDIATDGKTLEAKHYGFESLFYHPENIAAEYDTAIDAHITLDITNGTEVESAGWYTTQYMRVYPNLPYETNLTTPIVCCYNENYVYIGEAVVTNNTFNTPAYTRYVRMSTQTTITTDTVDLHMKYFENAVIAEDETYMVLDMKPSGRLKGIINDLALFKKYAHDAYEVDRKTVSDRQSVVTEIQDNLCNMLGPMYREGWWQKQDYIDGDEYKLYDDALDTLKKISRPEDTYQIGFLDYRDAYIESVDTDVPQIQNITTRSAAHIIDTAINESRWAFLDKIVRVFDQPWKTQITINTNLSTMTQHTFADVMQHIAEVAKSMKGKDTLYGRTMYIGNYGKLLAESIEGQLTTDKVKITNATSTVYQDDNGNWVFEQADQSSAMMLTGAGFALAQSKNEDGEWNWRTFGTGEGFSADMLTTGHLRANLIEAGTIVASMVSSSFGEDLNLASNASVRLLAESAVTNAIGDGTNLLKGATTEVFSTIHSPYLLNNVVLNQERAGTNQLTYNVYLIPTSGNAQAMLRVGDAEIPGNIIPAGQGGWSTVTVPVSNTVTVVGAYIQGASPDNSVSFHSAKVEFGKTATAFSMCQEDIQDTAKNLEKATLVVNPRFIASNVTSDTTYARLNLFSEATTSYIAEGGNAAKNGGHGFIATFDAVNENGNVIDVQTPIVINSAHASDATISFYATANTNSILTVSIKVGSQYDYTSDSIKLEANVMTRIVLPIETMQMNRHFLISTTAATLDVRAIMVEFGLAASAWCASDNAEPKSGLNLLPNGGFEIYETGGVLTQESYWYAIDRNIDDEYTEDRLINGVLNESNTSVAGKNFLEYRDRHINTAVLQHTYEERGAPEPEGYDIYIDPETGRKIYIDQTTGEEATEIPEPPVGVNYNGGSYKYTRMFHTPFELNVGDYYTFSCYLGRNDSSLLSGCTIEIWSLPDADELQTGDDLPVQQELVIDISSMDIPGTNVFNDYAKVEGHFKATATRHILWFNIQHRENYYINQTLFIAQCKLEEGMYSTPYTVCENSGETNKINNIIHRLVTVEQQMDIDSIATRVTETKNFSNAATEITQSIVQQTKNEFNVTLKTVTDNISSQKGEIDSIKSDLTWFSFTDDGLHIGKSTSGFSTLIDNTAMKFLQNDSPVAWISNQQLNISEAIVTGKFSLGKLVAVIGPNYTDLNWET